MTKFMYHHAETFGVECQYLFFNELQLFHDIVIIIYKNQTLVDFTELSSFPSRV